MVIGRFLGGKDWSSMRDFVCTIVWHTECRKTVSYYIVVVTVAVVFATHVRPKYRAVPFLC